MKDLARPPALTLLADRSRLAVLVFFLSSSSELLERELSRRAGSSAGLVNGLDIFGTDTVRERGALLTADVDFDRGLVADAEELPLIAWA
jgi:hypothetical protein